MKVDIKLIDPPQAKELCQAITATLPEWFGIPEANERYSQGMVSRISFAAFEYDECLGMITVEMPFPNNANIYWMGVKKQYRSKHIGQKLLRVAENYCAAHGCFSLTVETLSPRQHDKYYIDTYHFYERQGFKPLLEMHTYTPDNLMVYMQKQLGLSGYTFLDLTHTLTSSIAHWNTDCGFKHNIVSDYDLNVTSTTFRVQTIEMYAGVGTHMDAPSHCIPGTMDIDNIPLNQLIAPCVVIDVSMKANESYQVGLVDINNFEEQYGKINPNTFVVIRTGWDKFWDNPAKYRNNLIFPTVSASVAELLLKRGIIGLGVDTLSPDAAESDFPVHRMLLGAGKYIVENIANSAQLPPIGATTMALPIKIQSGTESPIRLIALIAK